MSPKLRVALLMGAFAIGAICTKSCSNDPTASFSGLQQTFALNIGSTFNISSDKVPTDRTNNNNKRRER